MKKQIIALAAIGVCALAATGALFFATHKMPKVEIEEDRKTALMDAIDAYIDINNIDVGHDGCHEVSWDADDEILVLEDDLGQKYTAYYDEDDVPLVDYESSE